MLRNPFRLSIFCLRQKTRPGRAPAGAIVASLLHSLAGGRDADQCKNPVVFHFGRGPLSRPGISPGESAIYALGATFDGRGVNPEKGPLPKQIGTAFAEHRHPSGFAFACGTALPVGRYLTLLSIVPYLLPQPSQRVHLFVKAEVCRIRSF